MSERFKYLKTIRRKLANRIMYIVPVKNLKEIEKIFHLHATKI